MMPVVKATDKDPYLKITVTKYLWNALYNQEAICTCGHPYYRHFDTYDNMSNVGCKYCECDHFVLAGGNKE